ncbi:MAG: hypothetical protein A2508_07080 [Candidatus Lambdaproteobacteria bacterium RIFOXYD12_FULL_49_8]|uniref:DUF350 domain-containing protein n=1 Tax=Candidatus Lambdaproteobacteria bacterium RIFOXYD2_FULL_50_16 TaxID=1817772 RepID=A0A1F6GFY4_9PROT|nr:MAG: hypothetical protein A2527_02880 [Candidatus Lambdaproteobacteria bacterium RIFOXYD2_FULL_50_16]OGG97435.1 MAG: hypothetical protein A2508_07080 [Candidatus Lambdaproteobacteria bacterium RIFOXYD12_FULL_49_8]
MDEIISEMFGFEGTGGLSHFPDLVLLVEALALMWVGKKLFDLACPFNLEEQLVKLDNKAISLNFVGYLTGLALILQAVVSGPVESLGQSMFEVLVWGLVGNGLLIMAGRVNNWFILKGIDNKQAMLEDSNLAVALVEVGSYLGSAAMIRAIILGESVGWAYDLGLTLFYFVLGQLSFVLYAFLYQKITSYDDLAEIKAGNAAAGITLGANLGAMGFLMAVPLSQSYSLVLFLAWFVIGNATLAGVRYALDHLVISSETLDHEIFVDKNWGAAALEGCFSVAAVLILTHLLG